jgi:hypothetical protein
MHSIDYAGDNRKQCVHHVHQLPSVPLEESWNSTSLLGAGREKSEAIFHLRSGGEKLIFFCFIDYYKFYYFLS